MPQSSLGDLLTYLRKVCASQEAHHLPDGDLITRFLTNCDQAAFAILVQRHGPMVLSVCQRLLSDGHAAEDAFQATFMVLARRAASVMRSQPLAGWLHGVARRVAVRAAAQTTARQNRERRHIPMQSPTPPDDLNWQELRAVLDEEIGRLPEKYRLPIVLCYLEGQTHEKAAMELGVAKSSLTTRLARARDLLRGQLARRGITLSIGALTTALADHVFAAPMAALLAINTVKAAASVAAGKAVVGGLVSARALLWAEQAMTGIVKAKMAVCVCVLALSVAIGGAAAVASQAWSERDESHETPKVPKSIKVGQAKGKTVDKEKEAAKGVDFHGDPLPVGAVARIGTTRFLQEWGGYLYPIAYTPDGKHLISIDGGKAVVFWDAATGKEVRRIEAKKEGIYTFVLSADGTQLATANYGYPNISVWDVKTCQEIHQITHKTLRTPKVAEHPASVVFTPDSKKLGVSKGDGVIRLWDTATWQELAPLPKGGSTLQLPNLGVAVYQFLPDGKTLISAYDEGYNSLTWRDAGTGKVIRRLNVESNYGYGWETALSPDGKRLAAVIKPGVLCLWNAATGEEISRTALGASNYCLRFSPDSQNLACMVNSQSKTLFFDATNGKELHHWSDTGDTVFIAYSPDGKTLALSKQTTIELRDVTTGNSVLAVQRLPEPVHSVGFTNNGLSMVIGLRDGRVSSWETLSGKPLGAGQDPPKVAVPQKQMMFAASFTSDGQKAGMVDANGVLHVWEPLTGKLLSTIENMETRGQRAAFSPDGKIVAMHDKKDIPGIWDTATGKRLHTLPAISIFRRVFSDDSRLLATAAISLDGVAKESVIRVWDTITGKLQSQLVWTDGTPVSNLIFSADAKYFISCHQVIDQESDQRSVRVWSLDTTKEVNRFDLPGVSIWSNDRSLALSPDFKTIATPTRDGLILWEIATGLERGRFIGHRSYVSALAFSPDGKLIASGSGDRTALVWDATGICPNGKWTIRNLSEAECERLWAELDAKDGITAYRAIWKLAAAPKQAVDFLKNRMLLPPAPADQLAKLITDLDSDRYAVRQEAVQALEKLGGRAEVAIWKALKNNPTLEAKQRLEQILKKQDNEVIRKLRAIEAIEHCENPAAAALLDALANDAPNPRVAEAARAARQRLSKLN
ncbi:MAG TPA: sigma-70 family RNA polymerase sigma factor [Gemmataceae bacterium]|nr:sigma-70 family RNA polymerase sigma factor [Gemmataceae bacterium]